MGGFKEGEVENTEKLGTTISANRKIYIEIKNRV
jgi:hypothetical protein